MAWHAWVDLHDVNPRQDLLRKMFVATYTCKSCRTVDKRSAVDEDSTPEVVICFSCGKPMKKSVLESVVDDETREIVEDVAVY